MADRDRDYIRWTRRRSRFPTEVVIVAVVALVVLVGAVVLLRIVG